MTTIRLALNTDISQIMNLMEQLGYPQQMHEFEIRFKKFSQIEGYGVAVAEQSALIVGWVAWSKTMLFVSSKTRTHIGLGR